MSTVAAYFRYDLNNKEIYWSVYTVNFAEPMGLYPIYEDPISEGGNFISVELNHDAPTVFTGLYPYVQIQKWDICDDADCLSGAADPAGFPYSAFSFY